jgi:hypothetical protein
MRQRTLARAVTVYNTLRAEGAGEKRAYHTALEQFAHESGLKREAADALLARELSAAEPEDWKEDEDD